MGVAFPITPISAVAPPGGCNVWVRYIKKIDNPTENPVTKKPEPKNVTRNTAIIADNRCPPTKLRGWVKLDSGAPKSKTAVAPKEPINNG